MAFSYLNIFSNQIYSAIEYQSDDITKIWFCEIANLVAIIKNTRWKMPPACLNVAVCHQPLMSNYHGYDLMTPHNPF